MSSDLPSIDELKRAVESGQRITPEDVSVIGQIESELTGGGPIQGGPAATAQRMAMRQMNFDEKLDELAHKPQNQITQEDARELQELEVCVSRLSGLVAMALINLYRVALSTSLQPRDPLPRRLGQLQIEMKHSDFLQYRRMHQKHL